MVGRQAAEGLTYRSEFVAGWTGPAQVRKGVTEPAGYTRLDVEYVDSALHASAVRMVAADLAILWRTIAVLARGQGLQF
jgi:hypothetical protein